jgi:hypothetical protein
MTSQLPRLGLLGITGIGQMAPAGAQALSRVAGGRSNGGRRNGGRRNGAKKKRARASGAKKRRRSSAKKPWMVKGSAAAKRHMAKLRRARKKK